MIRKGKTRTLVPYIILVGVLLPVLAVLQFIWLNQMSEAEKQRMMFNLGYASFFTADQVDRIAAQAYEAFDIGASDREDAFVMMDSRFRQWRAEHEDPRLIGSLYWVERSDSGAWSVFRLSPDDGFETLTAGLEAVEMIPAPDLRPAGGLNCSDEPALVIPTRYQEAQTPDGLAIANSFVVVRFDPDYLFGTYLPELLYFYFELEEPDTYRAAIIDDSDPPRTLAGTPGLTLDDADVAVSFLSLRARERLQPDYSGSMFSGTISERVAAAEKFFEETQDESEGDEQMAWGEGCWTVVASHRSGTIDSVVTRVRNQNLGISFVILVLLGASTVIVAILSQRSRKLAEQQMEFVAGVSHELRTPLAVIRSAGENLADSIVGEPDRVKKYGAIIRNEGQRLTGMVENILQFSRVQPGHNGYDLQPVSVLEVIDAALEACRRPLEKNAASVELNIDENLPDLLADPAALESALANLIANAAKHGAPNQTITVAAVNGSDGHGEVVRISVTDQGPGIPANEVSQLFEPFFRGARASESQIQGSGLGLAVARQVIEGHGGKITVDSAPGQGATFTLVLPVHREESH